MTEAKWRGLGSLFRLRMAQAAFCLLGVMGSHGSKKGGLEGLDFFLRVLVWISGGRGACVQVHFEVSMYKYAACDKAFLQ